ncbi:hypothetical protein H6F89_25690 [Cyanobacteria bacterium FACHB-63]|nr:hypothetical protein [Cyanobacteria bacterium FACHB-63]
MTNSLRSSGKFRYLLIQFNERFAVPCVIHAAHRIHSYYERTLADLP